MLPRRVVPVTKVVQHVDGGHGGGGLGEGGNGGDGGNGGGAQLSTKLLEREPDQAVTYVGHAALDFAYAP